MIKKLINNFISFFIFDSIYDIICLEKLGDKIMKGLFITFEGCEGSGKTSLINRLVAYLENEGIKVYKTREPGGSKIAEDIRNVILVS